MEQIVQDAVSAVEASAKAYRISNLQLMRAEVAGRRRSTSTILGAVSRERIGRFTTAVEVNYNSTSVWTCSKMEVTPCGLG